MRFEKDGKQVEVTNTVIIGMLTEAGWVPVDDAEEPKRRPGRPKKD